MISSALLVIAACQTRSIQAQTTAAPNDRYLARAKRILKETPLIDGHNDLPWRIREDTIARGNVDAYDLRTHTPGQTDLDRLRKGMIGAQFWSVYTPGEYRDSGYARVQLEQIDIARRMIEKYPDRLALALSPADIRREFCRGGNTSGRGGEECEGRDADSRPSSGPDGEGCEPRTLRSRGACRPRASSGADRHRGRLMRAAQ